MKKLYLFAAILALVLSSAHLTSTPAMAGQDLAMAGQDINDGLVAKNLCPNQIENRTAETTASKSGAPYLLTGLAGTSRPPIYASCSSDQWCCKHDIGGTGQCTKCCNK